MSNQHDDGGPAFPGWTAGHYTDQHPVGGMTLRDHFAAKALQAIIAAEGAYDYESRAAAAYDAADAMIRARQS